MTWTVDKKLLPVKLTYFFTFAAYASLYCYLSVYMKHLGITAWETSVICGTLKFIGALSRFGFGIMADKLHRHNAVLIICSVTSGIVFSLLWFVPEVSAGVSSSVAYVPVVCDVSGCFAILCFLPENLNSPCGSDVCDYDTPMPVGGWDVVMHDRTFGVSSCVWSCTAGTARSNRTHTNVDCNQTAITTTTHQCYIISKTDKLANLQNPMRIQFEVTKLTYYSSCNNTSKRCSRYKLGSSQSIGRDCVSMTCNTPTMLQCVHNCSIAEAEFHQEHVKATQTEPLGRTFWIFTGLFLVGEITFAPIVSLIDAMAYSFLGEERHKWGKQRLWGSLGITICAPITGFLVDVASRHSPRTNYTPMFVIFLMMQLFSASTSIKFPVTRDKTTSFHSMELKTLLRRPNVLCHFLLVFVLGILFGAKETFLFWHLKTIGEPPEFLFGLAIFICCLSEVIVMSISGWAILKIGHVNCLSLTCAMYSVHFLLYSQLTNPWMVVFIQPLAGFTNSLFCTSSTSYGSLITPDGLHGTVQSIIGALHFSIGTGIGTLEGGPIIELVGSSEMFRLHGLFALGVTCVYFLAHKCFIERTTMAPVDYNAVKTEMAGVALEMKGQEQPPP